MKHKADVMTLVKELGEMIDKYGYEAYRKATFAMDLGMEERLDEEVIFQGVEAAYEFYMETDDLTNPLNESIEDTFQEYVNFAQSVEETE